MHTATDLWFCLGPIPATLATDVWCLHPNGFLVLVPLATSGLKPLPLFDCLTASYLSFRPHETLQIPKLWPGRNSLHILDNHTMIYYTVDMTVHS